MAKKSNNTNSSSGTSIPASDERKTVNPFEPETVAIEETGEQVEGIVKRGGTKNLGIQMGLAALKLKKVDLFNGEEVQQRTEDYLKTCVQMNMVPTLTGYGNALGVDRRRLWEITSGKYQGAGEKYEHLPPSTLDTLKKMHSILEDQLVTHSLTGTVQPATGIFLLKANYGYEDKVTHEVKVQDAEYERVNWEELAERYGE